MENYNKKALEMHEKLKGKISVVSKKKLETKEDLSTAYTPGVAEPCRKINENPEDVYKYTIKGNTVAVITDGSSVLGLGNIGPEASIPVMEGKAVLFKEFADIDAFPICLAEQNIEKTIETIKNISPIFGGINLEDIKAPECFEIESQLQDLGIPVMHDDQHGTAIVVLAGLINSLKLKDLDKEEAKVVISGAGAAGIATTNLLLKYGFKSENLTLIDSKSTLNNQRTDLNKYKKEIAKLTNPSSNNLEEAIKNSDIFIGVSKPNILTKEMIQSMNEKPIIFALSNPNPEIMPNLAKEAGAFIIATGRSDFPNQVNNVLAFPGVFKGALEIRAKNITDKMKLAAAEALASSIKPEINKILPYALDKSIVPNIAESVKNAYKS
jgi:malate dehydrogenase (oxaloacetate-decarboxylating)